jgi:FkbM family methyltransferase
MIRHMKSRARQMLPVPIVHGVESILGAVRQRRAAGREAARYRSILHNGDEVYEENLANDSGASSRGLRILKFKNGATFAIRDSLSAQPFREIFLEDHYPKDLLRGARTIVDVGANIGLFSYYARLQSPTAVIHAFEADPFTFALLSRNVSKHSIHCHHAALASKDGEVDFYSSHVSGWSSAFQTRGAVNAERVKVRSMRMSQFLRAEGISHIDFLKVDVEGAEYDILLGDPAIWSVATIKCLAVEVDRNPRDNRYSFAALLALLKSRFRYVTEVEKDGRWEYPVFICTG